MVNLVAGGAGFIGSHLCKKLLEKNEQVLCVDNFYTGKKDNIKDLLNNSKFELVRHDITFPLYLEVDRIYNLACPASPKQYEKNPVQTLKTSVHGSINLLGLSKRLNARILQSSTSEVYGDPLESPQREEYFGNVNPIGSRSCYDEGKRCAETLFNDYHKQHGVEVKIMRIFNTYGPNMDVDDGRVISNFIIQALKGESLTIYGDGQQTRCFCYINDLIEGMLDFMNTDKSFIGPMNVGNDEEETMLSIAEKIINLAKSKSKIIFLDPVKDDPRQRKPDLSLAKKKINWNPKVPLEAGLLRTIEYFKSVI
ncbi:MAG TPA: SDR family oxidoreductase [Candidatus Dadabacteria bacterium]|nr:SDR family oxidoreductase [Candidatus Dadabacteria bacterium]